MYEDPDITLMGDDTDEYPQDEYDTTDVYINQDENQDGQEDHK